MYCMGLFTCSIYTIYAASCLCGRTVSTTGARRGADKSQSAEQGDRNADSMLTFLCVCCMYVCIRLLWACMHVLDGFVHAFYIYYLCRSSLCGGTVSTTRARRGADKSQSTEEGDRNPESVIITVFVCARACASLA